MPIEYRAVTEKDALATNLHGWTTDPDSVTSAQREVRFRCQRPATRDLKACEQANDGRFQDRQPDGSWPPAEDIIVNGEGLILEPDGTIFCSAFCKNVHAEERPSAGHE